MTNVSRQVRPQRPEPGLAILAARILFAIQDELYARLDTAGHSQLTRLHGAVIAHLDENGTRPTELARRSGRHKQVIGRIVDELEALGYVERRSEHGDRRAKLIVPTARGLEAMQFSDEIIRDIERRPADALGTPVYRDFREKMRTVADALQSPPHPTPGEANRR